MGRRLQDALRRPANDYPKAFCKARNPGRDLRLSQSGSLVLSGAVMQLAHVAPNEDWAEATFAHRVVEVDVREGVEYSARLGGCSRQECGCDEEDGTAGHRIERGQVPVVEYLAQRRWGWRAGPPEWQSVS